MHESQLQDLRREKWRLNNQAMRSLEDARAFVESVGFCLLYPQRPPVLAPTFVGAYKGSDGKLPTAQMAFADREALDAKELMVRLLREKSAYEASVFPDNNFILSASVFPYFYGLVGDRNPKQPPKAGARSGYSQLAVDAFPIIQKDGPIAKQRLRELLGRDISEAALDRALDELWARLRITRVDYKQDEGIFWDVLFRWAPEAVKQGMHVSVAESLTALISKYLDCVLAAQEEEIEQFFSRIIGSARVREGIHALQATRQLRYAHVGGRVMLQVSSQQIPQSSPADPAFKQNALMGAHPPERGRPLVDRRPHISAGSAKSDPPIRGTGKE